MMQKVLGIGGLFFRARDPGALAQWYEDALGITQVPKSYDAECWEQAAGETVFAPFPADTDHFGDPAQQFMVNFRVADLDAMVAQLTRMGVEVTIDPDPYPNGRFARLKDPEGNPIELWQPA